MTDPSGKYQIPYPLNSPYTHFFYKQPHFRDEPRVAMKIPKMRLKVVLKLLSTFGIEAKVAKLFDNFRLKCMENKQKLAKIDKGC